MAGKLDFQFCPVNWKLEKLDPVNWTQLKRENWIPVKTGFQLKTGKLTLRKLVSVFSQLSVLKLDFQLKTGFSSFKLDPVLNWIRSS